MALLGGQAANQNQCGGKGGGDMDVAISVHVNTVSVSSVSPTSCVTDLLTCSLCPYCMFSLFHTWTKPMSPLHGGGALLHSGGINCHR